MTEQERRRGRRARQLAKWLGQQRTDAWIAKRWDMTPASVGVLISRLRAQGYSMPYRHDWGKGLPKCPISKKSRMPVAPLRAAFLSHPATASELARRLNWYRPGGKADDTRVRQRLALDRRPYPARSIDQDEALAIVQALGLDPVDVGL